MPNTALRDAVREHCVAERQWPRHLRIAFAQRMVDHPHTPPSDRKFWREVLKHMGAK